MKNKAGQLEKAGKCGNNAAVRKIIHKGFAEKDIWIITHMYNRSKEWVADLI